MSEVSPSSASTGKTSTDTSADINPGTGTCTLLLFGPAQSYCDDTDSLTLPAPTTLSAIFDEVEKRYRGFGEKVLKGSQVVVNLEYVEWEWESPEKAGGEVRVNVGDEVGVVPPVSAG